MHYLYYSDSLLKSKAYDDYWFLLYKWKEKDVKPRIPSSCLSLWKYERLAVFDKNSSLNSHSRLNIKVCKSKPPLPRSIEHIKFWPRRKVLRRLRGWFDASALSLIAQSAACGMAALAFRWLRSKRSGSICECIQRSIRQFYRWDISIRLRQNLL